MIEQLTDHHYDVLSVPEDAAANCVYVRGAGEADYLLHPAQDECPISVSVSFASLSRYTNITSRGEGHGFQMTLQGLNAERSARKLRNFKNKFFFFLNPISSIDDRSSRNKCRRDKKKKE